ncbi:hypothetical protein [Undibacterium umbellatum]|uniref:Uncharacterized protein n=1 Tax=Undibacterium umbellatum TaxID=2762300 RepID=A0ABR6Z8P8_9BURK|nr:hypothetical protein [Undibacterium umbellatum]MBC3908048.1 hypothetical protein [Undibacterium umbellatum]
MKHSRQLRAVGNALFDARSSQCMAIAYGWQAEAHYDASGNICNPDALQPSDEAIANARVWAMAPELLDRAQALAARLRQDSQWFAAPEAQALRQLCQSLEKATT